MAIETAGAPAEVFAYVRALAEVISEHAELVGVYLHGSAALGGFDAGSSDVDVLAVVGGAATEARQRKLGEALAAAGPDCPGAGLELSVITAATAAELGDCRFELHVATGEDGQTVIAGAGHPGDPDLVLHTAVCRGHAITVTGPPPAAVFGPVPRDRVLGALADELRWGLEHGSAPYAVLNACRALRFAAEGRFCSKVAGGRWYLARDPANPVVADALSDQERGARPALTPSAVRFVTEVITAIANEEG